MYGPLVMAAVTEQDNRYSAISSDRAHLFDCFKSVAGKPLEFTASQEVFRTSATTIPDRTGSVQAVAEHGT